MFGNHIKIVLFTQKNDNDRTKVDIEKMVKTNLGVVLTKPFELLRRPDWQVDL